MEKEYEHILEFMYDRTFNDKLIIKSRLLDVKGKIELINKQIKRCKTINSSAEFMNIASFSKVTMAKNMNSVRQKLNLKTIMEGVEMLEDEKEEINRIKLGIAKNMIEKEQLAVDLREDKLKIFELSEEEKYIKKRFRSRKRFKDETICLERIDGIVRHLEMKRKGKNVDIDSLSKSDLFGQDQKKKLDKLVKKALDIYNDFGHEQRNSRIEQDEMMKEILRKKTQYNKLARRRNKLMVIEEEEEDEDVAEEGIMALNSNQNLEEQVDMVSLEYAPEQRTKSMLDTDSRINSDMLLLPEQEKYEFTKFSANDIIREYKREKKLISIVFNFEEMFGRFLKLTNQVTSIVYDAYASKSHYLVDDLRDKGMKFEVDLEDLKSKTEFANFFTEDTTLQMETSKGSYFPVRNELNSMSIESESSRNYLFNFKALQSNYNEFFTKEELKRLCFYLNNDRIVNCYCTPGQFFAQLDLVKFDNNLYSVVEDFIFRVKTMGYNAIKDKVHRLFIMLSDLFYIYKRNLVLYELRDMDEFNPKKEGEERTELTTTQPESRRKLKKKIKPITSRNMIPQLKKAMESRFNTRKRLPTLQKTDNLNENNNLWMEETTPFENLETDEDKNKSRGYKTTHGGFYREADIDNSDITLLIDKEEKEKKEMIETFNDLKDIESAIRFQKKTAQNFNTKNIENFKSINTKRKKKSTSVAPRRYQNRKIKSQQQHIRSRTNKIVEKNSNRKKKRNKKYRERERKKTSNYRIRRKSSAATRPNTTAFNRKPTNVRDKLSPYGNFLVPLSKKQKKKIEKKLTLFGMN